jgi:hypothetical protein
MIRTIGLYCQTYPTNILRSNFPMIRFGSCETDVGEATYAWEGTQVWFAFLNFMDPDPETNEGVFEEWQGKPCLVLETSLGVKYQGSADRNSRRAIERGLKEMLGYIL